MATLKTILSNIEKNNFDYARAYAETQSSNPTVISELIQSYNLIAENLGISVYQFLQQLNNQSTPQQQAIYLAAQLNSVRPRNSLIGLAPSQVTPQFIAREIAA